MTTLYYYENPVGIVPDHGTVEAANDQMAISLCPNTAILIYKESDTADGQPYIIVKDTVDVKEQKLVETPKTEDEKIRELYVSMSAIAWLVNSLRIDPNEVGTAENLNVLIQVLKELNNSYSDDPIFRVIFGTLTVMVAGLEAETEEGRSASKELCAHVARTANAFHKTIKLTNQSLRQAIEAEVTYGKTHNYTPEQMLRAHTLLEGVCWCTSKPTIIKLVAKMNQTRPRR